VIGLDGEPALDVMLADLSVSLEKPQEALSAVRSTLVGIAQAPTGSDSAAVRKTGNFGSEALKRKLQNWPEEFIGGAGLLNQFKNDAVRNNYEIVDSEPTDPQSEILVLDPIPWSYITKIISPGLRGYATQEEIRKVVQLLPRGAVFQSQNPEIFPEINWKDPKIIAEFNERKWNESWE
jgi:hypothetical protein